MDPQDVQKGYLRVFYGPSRCSTEVSQGLLSWTLKMLKMGIPGSSMEPQDVQKGTPGSSMDPQHAQNEYPRVFYGDVEKGYPRLFYAP